MRSFILLAIAVATVSGSIWFVSSDPHARERLETEAKFIKMDIDAMTRQVGHLPVTKVDSFM